jgi:site-specific DNA-methyltransferase (adenine-specific)
MREPTKPEYGTVKKGLGNRKTNGTTIYDTSKIYKLPEEKEQGTVIHYKNSSRETPKSSEIGKIKLQHPATFPDKLASDFIQCFTKEGMIVLDPFMGSGTVAAMAKKLNRNYIGFEISKEYCDIAKQRLKLLI